MGGILPGMRSGYRTTPEMFKWIVLAVILGCIGFYLVIRYFLSNVDEIYQGAGYPEDSRFIKEKSGK